MKPFLRSFAVCIMMTAAAAMAEDLIIESRPEGQNYDDKYKETAGKWLDSNNPAQTAKSSAPGLTAQGTCGSRKYSMPPVPPADKKEILASAMFSPKFAAAGHYHVYVTFPKAANCTPTFYVIKHAGGETVKTIAQDGWGGVGNPNSGFWISLGDYDFSAGNEQWVEMRVTGESGAADPRTPGQAFADGIRFAEKPLTEGTLASPKAAPTPPPALAATPAPAVASAGTQAPAPSAAVAPAPPVDTTPLSWQEDIKAAQKDATEKNKKIFVFFYSPESERSKNYDSKIFNDAKVKATLKSKFVLVRVNIDENRSLASSLQVFRAGTINLYDERGAGLAQFTETLDAEDLTAKLSSF